MEKDEDGVIHTCIGDFKPVVVSKELTFADAHYCPTIDCPFCTHSGQMVILLGRNYANYCPGCKVTWIYEFTRIPFSLIGDNNG